MPPAKTFTLLLSLLLAVACTAEPANEASQVGDAFVKAYYIETNLEAARQYCVALACKKLMEEKSLSEGQVVNAETKRPKVTQKLLKELDAGADAKRLIYQLTVRADGLESFTREAYVKVRKVSGRWQVSQFAELINGMPDTGL